MSGDGSKLFDLSKGKFIQEEPMEKYGQRTGLPDELEKTGTGDILCPECGAKCEVHGSVVKCPEHGTAPFAKEGD